MSLRDWLRNGPLLADGAWGTELQNRGLEPDSFPDLWNLTAPEQVRAVARGYREAGSQVILTNTFRSNRISLAGWGLSDRVADLNRAGVAISQEAGDGLVFASIGPTGKLLLTGDVTEHQLEDAFQEQAEALSEADALLIETMSDLEEARIALAAARTTGLPVIVSFAFDTGRNKDRTMMGVTPEQAARAMTEQGADAVGANCGATPEAFLTICTRMRQATDLPLWMKPNTGDPSIAAQLPAAFIGGCCGTNATWIRALGRVGAFACRNFGLRPLSVADNSR
jgi:methionine synthase I (cobalamin-dependent)